MKAEKVKIIVEIIGLITVFSFGFFMHFLTIAQWFSPGHEMLVYWNHYNEAFFEYVWALFSLPCVLYFFKLCVRRLCEKLNDPQKKVVIE